MHAGYAGGTAGDGLSALDDTIFNTFDRNNAAGCAKEYQGGYWGPSSGCPCVSINQVAYGSDFWWCSSVGLGTLGADRVWMRCSGDADYVDSGP